MTTPDAPASVGIRALKQNASQVIARVVKGERIIVTDRSRPVARVVPFVPEPTSVLQDLINRGLVTMPTEDVGDYVRSREVDGVYVPPIAWDGEGPSLTDTLLAMRDEERY